MDTKYIYTLLFDENQKFLTATQNVNGDYIISRNNQPNYLTYNPANVAKIAFELATNRKYNSLARSISYPLEFIKDGAAILRELYFNGKGTEAYCGIKIMNWDGFRHSLLYDGRIDFNAKTEDPKSGKFTVPIVDDSVWSDIARNDSVQYSIECNESNPDAIKVMFDGINMRVKFIYETVRGTYRISFKDFDEAEPNGTQHSAWMMPLVKIDTEGDSVGIITKDNIEMFSITSGVPLRKKEWVIKNQNNVSNIDIAGVFTFSWKESRPSYIDLKVHGQYSDSEDAQWVRAVGRLDQSEFPQPDVQYSIPFTFHEYAAYPGVEYSLIITTLALHEYINDDKKSYLTIYPTKVTFSSITRVEQRIIYAIRPLDLIKQLVQKATDGKRTISSSFFTTNNKQVVTCGDAIRGFDNAKIYTSIEDFFKTYNSLFYMALRSVAGQLQMELATEVYRQDSQLFDIGECIDLKLNTAEDWIVNEVQVGSPKVDMRHPDGRLEFNSTNTFSLPIKNSDGKYEIITKYRTGCYDITFLLLDYVQGSTKDNTGDKTCYVLDITDVQGGGSDIVENFEEFTVNNNPLAPYISSPNQDDIITNDKPTIKGVAPVGSTVNIYADGVLDGSTLPDSVGNWSYTLINPLSSYEEGIPTATGQHLIQASFTDLAATTSNLNIVIDTNISTEIRIIYPATGDTLYNNQFLIKGVAQAGTAFTLTLDGIFSAPIVADGSCTWEYKLNAPLNNANHTLQAGTHTIVFTVNNRVEHPIITYIGQELNAGVPLIDNTPLVMGVAMPGTVVELFLNYDSHSIGSAIADSLGNWTFQTVPFSYPDVATGVPVMIVPIRNGDNIMSTSMRIETVEIGITGFMLNRPPYSVITGVEDNTVFNVELSPKRMLQHHYPYLASVMDKLPQEVIEFQTADKNPNLATVLDGVATIERADVPTSSLGEPLFRLEKAIVKTPTRIPFDKALALFNNGGVIRATYRGAELFFLPVGSMKMETITSAVQDWTLIFSPMTPFSTLINLYKDGTTINIMANSLFHSDYNSLHFVSYDFKDIKSYNFKTIYSDWFENRNEAWMYNPHYMQKYQKTETIRDQIISNGAGDLKLHIFRCETAMLVGTIPYSPVDPNPTPAPYIVFEAAIDLSTLPEDQYFFVIEANGKYCAISERIHVMDKWLGTILIESTNSINKTTFFYSTGIRTVLRLEGLVKKIQPNIFTDVSVDESGGSTLLYSTTNKKRTIRFGTAYGLPDYLYIKVANAIINDAWTCEGVKYTIEDGEKIDAASETDGHPLYYYNVRVLVALNENGATFVTETLREDNSVVLVVDAEAMGIPLPSLTDIGLQNE